MMTLFLVTFLAVLVVFLLMALGAIFGRPPIKGSCGGAGECLCAKGVPCREKQLGEGDHAA